MTEVLFGH